jgi:hypothetical protein
VLFQASYEWIGFDLLRGFMDWGAGPTLGLLASIGYLLLALGAARVWRHWNDFSIWVHDEISTFRRTFSRYTPAGPFYVLREESRFKAIPTSFVGSLSRLPRSRANGAAILVVIGLLLFLLDFFV